MCGLLYSCVFKQILLLYHFELFGHPLSPAHWPWPKSVTCPLSPTRFDPILTTVGQTNIKKLPNLGLIVTIYSRWPIAKFRPCCPLSPPQPNNSKWYSIGFLHSGLQNFCSGGSTFQLTNCGCNP